MLKNVAYRCGLYHFGTISVVSLVSAAAQGPRDIPSRLSAAISMLEVPGLALVEAVGLQPARSIVGAVLGWLAIIAFNSMLYGVLIYVAGKAGTWFVQYLGSSAQTERRI